MNSFFIYIGVKPTVFQLLYGSYPYCRGIVTSDVLVKGLSCGAIATRKLEGVKSGQGTRESLY